jgi:hypothetical protein
VRFELAQLFSVFGVETKQQQVGADEQKMLKQALVREVVVMRHGFLRTMRQWQSAFPKSKVCSWEKREFNAKETAAIRKFVEAYIRFPGNKINTATYSDSRRMSS